MSVAFKRTEASLTKSQRTVLSFLTTQPGPAETSSRKLAATLGLSRSTVQIALAVLNERGLLHTLSGSPNRMGVHTVLEPGSKPGSALAPPVKVTVTVEFGGAR